MTPSRCERAGNRHLDDANGLTESSLFRVRRCSARSTDLRRCSKHVADRREPFNLPAGRLPSLSVCLCLVPVTLPELPPHYSSTSDFQRLEPEMITITSTSSRKSTSKSGTAVSVPKVKGAFKTSGRFHQLFYSLSALTCSNARLANPRVQTIRDHRRRKRGKVQTLACGSLGSEA